MSLINITDVCFDDALARKMGSDKMKALFAAGRHAGLNVIYDDGVNPRVHLLISLDWTCVAFRVRMDRVQFELVMEDIDSLSELIDTLESHDEIEVGAAFEACFQRVEQTVELSLIPYHSIAFTTDEWNQLCDRMAKMLKDSAELKPAT